MSNMPNAQHKYEADFRNGVTSTDTDHEKSSCFAASDPAVLRGGPSGQRLFETCDDTGSPILSHDVFGGIERTASAAAASSIAVRVPPLQAAAGSLTFPAMHSLLIQGTIPG